METRVTILHGEYPEHVRGLVEQKLEQLERLQAPVHRLRAQLHRRRDEHRVELVAEVGRGAVLVADVRGAAFGGTLDEALERMTLLLTRRKEKRAAARRALRRA
jgi:ribosomal subunit interface protein